MKSLRSLRTKTSGFFADISISKWMQLWLESLFRSRDYLLCVVHFKSSNTQRSISKGRNENTSAAEILGFQLRNLSRSIGKNLARLFTLNRRISDFGRGADRNRGHRGNFKTSNRIRNFYLRTGHPYCRNFGTVPNVLYYGYREA